MDKRVRWEEVSIATSLSKYIIYKNWLNGDLLIARKVETLLLN
jgi:hypothetical protein